MYTHHMVAQIDSTCEKSVVILAGVMCRGAAGGIHPAWALLQKNVIRPLQAKGTSVIVWGFNNVPKSIDGDPVPRDGGRSYFGRLDHYEAWDQYAIDSSPEAASIARIAKHLVPGNRKPGAYDNMARFLFLQDKACAHLRAEREAGTICGKTRVVLMSPDLCLFGGPIAKEILTISDGQLGILTQNNREVENGFLVGSIDNVLAWHARHMKIDKVPPPHDYEAWCKESMSEFKLTELRPNQGFHYCHYNGRTFRGHEPVPIAPSGRFPWKRSRIDGGACPKRNDGGDAMRRERPNEYRELHIAVRALANAIASNNSQ